MEGGGSGSGEVGGGRPCGDDGDSGDSGDREGGRVIAAMFVLYK